MWQYSKEQKIFDINGIKIGGQPGVHPPLLVANMFQKGDTLLESRKEAKFNHAAAEARIKELENISQVTGIPAMVAMVANRAEEMQVYVDFFTSVTDMPFAIDIWVQKTRLKSWVSNISFSRCLIREIRDRPDGSNRSTASCLC
jgi:tetrahydromethanopterin S-methyltransferase subunit H